MKSLVMGLLAETSIHPGTGQNVGVVDLPVSREATGYPVIVGSSMKGALRDKARDLEKLNRQTENESIRRLFGSQEAAARMGVTDARLLLLPIRSLTTHFRWVTCPYIMERLQRDLLRLGINPDFPQLKLMEGEGLTIEGTGTVYLEELAFELRTEPGLQAFVERIKPFIRYQSVQERLAQYVTVISDTEFAYFARNGLTVSARNVLDDGKRSKNLWYEESLPPDTLFYSILFSRDERDLESIAELFQREPYLQVGGNETVGQGWLAVALMTGRD